MNKNRNVYLKEIRAATAYPTYRQVVNLIAIISRGLGIIVLLFSILIFIIFITSEDMDGTIFMQAFMLFFLGGFTYVMANFWKEAAIVVVDMAESIIEVNSRRADD